jgi:hypothetical protein
MKNTPIMSQKQIDQFNRMRATLLQICRGYASTEQIHKNAERIGLAPEEEIEMAYDNIQSAAAFAIKGVRALKPKGGQG